MTKEIVIKIVINSFKFDDNKDCAGVDALVVSIREYICQKGNVKTLCTTKINNSNLIGDFVIRQGDLEAMSTLDDLDKYVKYFSNLELENINLRNKLDDINLKKNNSLLHQVLKKVRRQML